MKRREAIAGLGALGVLGVGGAVAFGGLDVFGSSEGDRIEALELPRIDAPGSPSGTELVPEEGRITYIARFATWCTICQDKMDPLGEAAAAVDDDVQFVSVTDELIGRTIDREDVVEWWVDHDGAWPLVHDENHELTRSLDEPRVPYSVVLDADNRVTWSEGGYKDADEILAAIEGA